MSKMLTRTGALVVIQYMRGVVGGVGDCDGLLLGLRGGFVDLTVVVVGVVVGRRSGTEKGSDK